MADKSLYDRDLLAWSEEQAAALRKLAARADLPNALDLENIIDEVETLGRSELAAFQSNLRNALEHILKGVCDPGCLSVPAWDAETDAFLSEARSHYTPSMRQKIDLQSVWLDAFRRAHKALAVFGRKIPPGLPREIPFTLDELLDPAFSFDIGRDKVIDACRKVESLQSEMTPNQETH